MNVATHSSPGPQHAFTSHAAGLGIGVGLKPLYYATVLEQTPALGFFEVHAENYMGEGGPPHRYLTAIRERYPLSLHGVGLSIGGAQRLSRPHLSRLRTLLDRYQPALFSEHLAWSTHRNTFYDDLLPLPYTTETLRCVARHIHQVQETLGRQMLLENPATYVAFKESSYAEWDFLAEIVRRTGCALLLDVNNVYVACTNQGWSPEEYLDRYPLRHVREVHLAGHATREDEEGRPLRVDTHDRPVATAVWELYERVIQRLGPMSSLIEWDAKLPPWEELLAQAERAEVAQRAASAPLPQEASRAAVA